MIKFLRGTTAENDAYTGAAGTITIDTDQDGIRVHDGVTQGGHELANMGRLRDTFLSGGDNSLTDGNLRLSSAGNNDSMTLSLVGSRSGTASTLGKIAFENDTGGSLEEVSSISADGAGNITIAGNLTIFGS